MAGVVGGWVTCSMDTTLVCAELQLKTKSSLAQQGLLSGGLSAHALIMVRGLGYVCSCSIMYTGVG